MREALGRCACFAVLSLMTVCVASCDTTASSATNDAERPAPNSTVRVPSVEAKSSRRARKTIRKAGLRPKVKRLYDDNVDKGDVIRQSPSAGKQVDSGARVFLAVSKGAKP